MKKYELRRWKDFALRMARNGYPAITEERKNHLKRDILEMFDTLESNKEWRGITDWDGDSDSVYFGDFFAEFFERHTHWNRNEEPRDTKFISMLHCCVRAGLDMASKQSGGVIGFNKADILRMYPSGVPHWVMDFDVPWDEIPDDDGLWL